MRLPFPVALAVLAFCPATALAQPPIAAVAPIAYQSRTLANGLRVYSIRDTSSSNVSVQVWYDVGSKDDPRGRSGFAHLFEHMMFKATRNLVPEQFDRLTEDVGGFNNASTTDDYTNYYEVVPANHLQRLLWAEAERMSSLVIEPGFFASERDVVKEELRSRVLAQPYGRLFYLYLPQISYDVHPYARPGIGSIEDLDAATIEDVRAFHATYYRPDNAVLVVAGNFDQAQFDRWVDLYFAPITRPTTAIPRVTAREPERTAARTLTVYEPNTPLPAVLLAFPAPSARDEDAAALEVLDGILSTGDSSRLHQALVYRDQTASQASSFVDTKQGRAHSPLMRSSPRVRPPRREKRPCGVKSRVSAICRSAIPSWPRRRMNSSPKRCAIGKPPKAGRRRWPMRSSSTATRRAADRRLARIAAITQADIQRVARRWLRDEASTAVRYLPEESQQGAREDQIVTAATVATATVTSPGEIRIVQPAPESERVAPPPPGPEIVPPVPTPVVQRLANGLNLVIVRNPALPLVTAALVAGGGAAADPDGRAGLADLTAAVMTEGTTSRSAAEIDAAVEALGSSLSSNADWDGSTLGITVQTGQADAALAIVADVARNARLAEEELERQRAIAIDGFTVALSDPGVVSGMAAMRALYGRSAYGHPEGGTATSLRAIGRADIEAAYRATWVPGNVTLILSGDIDPERARALAERHFGSWTGSAVTARAAPTVQSATRSEVVVIDMPGSGQAAVAVARNALDRRNPNYYRAVVANAILGGGYSARLNQEIRIRRGLSYGSSSGIAARRATGPFVASTQTRNDAAAEVLGLILGEMRRLGAEPISVAELTARRASLTGDFGRDTETTVGTASLIAGFVMRGLGPEELGPLPSGRPRRHARRGPVGGRGMARPGRSHHRHRRRGITIRRSAAA